MLCKTMSMPESFFIAAGTLRFAQLIYARRVPKQGQKWSDTLLSSIRILIADDLEDWRRQVRFLLQARPEWQVIAEAADGSEAIQKAEELKPDLIVLDIGLPKLNGIEAARQIRQLSPSSKILFLSQNNDLDVVRAALGTAQGYVYKTDFRRDFLPAIQAVLRGQQFVSSSLKGYEFTDTAGEKTPHRHEVQFYSDDAVFLDSFAHFIATALKSGRAAIACYYRVAPEWSRFEIDRHRVWTLMPPPNRGHTFNWMLPKRFPHSWSMVCLTRLDFSRLQVASSRQRPKRRGKSIMALWFVENVHLHCGRKVRRTPRFA